MGFYITDETRNRGPRAAAPPWGPKPARGPIREVISGYRFYNPNLGRWINRDPIGEYGGINVYIYNLNNSIDGWDYLGKKSLLDSTDEAAKAILKALKKSEDHDIFEAIEQVVKAGGDWQEAYNDIDSNTQEAARAYLAVVATAYDDKTLMEEIVNEWGEDLVQTGINKLTSKLGTTLPGVGYALKSGDAVGSTIGNYLAEQIKKIHGAKGCECCLVEKWGSIYTVSEEGEYKAATFTCLLEDGVIYVDALKPDKDAYDDSLSKNIIDLIGKPETWWKKCGELQ